MENLSNSEIQNLLMSFPSSEKQSHIIIPADQYVWPNSTGSDFHGQNAFVDEDDGEKRRLIKRLMCSSNASLQHSQPSDVHDQLQECTKQGSEEQNEDQKLNVTSKEGKSVREAAGKGGHQTMISSHSLAERVRRERINERMRFLQDLVPGCNKITGKALMLDEIINYVQSLQRQVEFLSMKLAAVYSEMEVPSDNDTEPPLSQDIRCSKSYQKYSS